MQYQLHCQIYCEGMGGHGTFIIGNRTENFKADDDGDARKYVAEFIERKNQEVGSGQYYKAQELKKIYGKERMGIVRVIGIEQAGKPYRIYWGCTDVEDGWHKGVSEFEAFDDEVARQFFGDYIKEKRLLPDCCELLRIDQEEKNTKIA
ncbi:MAG: hypothetical protein A3C58_00345 [Candidatus Staskawiczbacteria bacterium RIFCSPHIGHO2_02_FULL_34_10]|uniref:Uncharacterized protein n=1 Tax=Candidatus Staskawiczbacteria bacterium RIFCSPHIGHO2_02_FULL_34_10 TaxID=1802205 RepID=A0A1G2HTX0_9BACT|nr:MAG: hypothetical protein A3C58_00345 [Candidatus Staskawiczbacteria bacterium RIFCSPHIGHO2_02_FULL_34_10]